MLHHGHTRCLQLRKQSAGGIDQNLNKHTRFFGLTKPLNYLTLYAMLLATFPEDLHAMLRE